MVRTFFIYNPFEPQHSVCFAYPLPSLAMKGALAICLLFGTFQTIASPYQPNPDETVASWQAITYSDQQGSSLERLAWHFERAQYPGMENLHLARAAEILAANQSSTEAEYAYFSARLYQHQHDFERAKVILNKLLSSQPKNTNALLLESSVNLIQANYEEALSGCKKLLGAADIYLASTCMLEVQSYQSGQLEKSYARLSQLVKPFNLNQIDKLEEEIRTQLIWMIQILADMALRMNKPDVALNWLGSFDVEDMPISYLTLWADTHRQLDQHAEILNLLGPIVEDANYKDDALLVRLAMAAQAMNDDSNSRWKIQIEERVKLRIAREDEYHAADLARYFLFVEPDGTQAHKWANINYQHAKMPEDLMLLKQAHKLVEIGQGEL